MRSVKAQLEHALTHAFPGRFGNGGDGNFKEEGSTWHTKKKTGCVASFAAALLSSLMLAALVMHYNKSKSFYTYTSYKTRI